MHHSNKSVERSRQIKLNQDISKSFDKAQVYHTQGIKQYIINKDNRILQIE